jgi:hypothetical protein
MQAAYDSSISIRMVVLQLALAPNIGTVLVCRFIQGFSGS